jgi:hypothetical protein
VPVTALEQAIAGSQMLPVTNRTVTLTMDRALTTLSITPGTPDGVGRMESARSRSSVEGPGPGRCSARERGLFRGPFTGLAASRAAGRPSIKSAAATRGVPGCDPARRRPAR